MKKKESRREKKKKNNKKIMEKKEWKLGKLKREKLESEKNELLNKKGVYQ